MPIRKAPRERLTKTLLNNISLPQAGSVTIYDDEVKKLSVTAYPSGKKTFILRVRYNGQPDQIKLGCYPDMSVEQARKLAMDKLSAIADGKSPRSEKSDAQKEPTLQEYFDRYRARSKKKSIGDDESYFRLYMQKRWGNKRLSVIKRTQIEELHNEITKRAPCSANHAVVFLRTLYNQAIEDEVFHGKNPALGIRLNQVNSRERFISETEMPYFLSAVRADENMQVSSFFLLLLFTGQRKSNLLSMRWQDIELINCEWFIPQTKNGKSHRVVLCPEAMQILNGMERDMSPWVFPANSKKGHMVAVEKGWGRIKQRATAYQLIALRAQHEKWDDMTIARCHKDAEVDLTKTVASLKEAMKEARINISGVGLDDLRIHDLRRTYGSWLARSGASLHMVGTALGHKSLASTKIYAQFGNDYTWQCVGDMVNKMVSGEIMRFERDLVAPAA